MSKIKQKILLVDDARDTLEILQRNLESAGYQVFAAICVEDGIKLLESTPVHLVITDYKMPKISGEVLIEMVKGIEDMDVKIVVITGGIITEFSKEKRDMIRASVNGYINKPFDRKAIYTTVKSILDN